MSGISKVIISVLLPILFFNLQIPIKIASAPISLADQTVQEDEESDPARAYSDLAIEIHDAIVHIETGGTGDCTLPGASGETGCHQFMPRTWDQYSKDVFGYVAKQTEKNAKHVAITKIDEWLAEGKTARQIFLIWNQGNPGACVEGINKYGVYYNSCAYAEYALSILDRKLFTLADK